MRNVLTKVIIVLTLFVLAITGTNFLLGHHSKDDIVSEPNSQLYNSENTKTTPETRTEIPETKAEVSEAYTNRYGTDPTDDFMNDTEKIISDDRWIGIDVEYLLNEGFTQRMVTVLNEDFGYSFDTYVYHSRISGDDNVEKNYYLSSDPKQGYIHYFFEGENAAEASIKFSSSTTGETFSFWTSSTEYKDWMSEADWVEPVDFYSDINYTLMEISDWEVDSGGYITLEDYNEPLDPRIQQIEFLTKSGDHRTIKIEDDRTILGTKYWVKTFTDLQLRILRNDYSEWISVNVWQVSENWRLLDETFEPLMLTDDNFMNLDGNIYHHYGVRYSGVNIVELGGNWLNQVNSVTLVITDLDENIKYKKDITNEAKFYDINETWMPTLTRQYSLEVQVDCDGLIYTKSLGEPFVLQRQKWDLEWDFNNTSDKNVIWAGWDFEVVEDDVDEIVYEVVDEKLEETLEPMKITEENYLSNESGQIIGIKYENLQLNNSDSASRSTIYSSIIIMNENGEEVYRETFDMSQEINFVYYFEDNGVYSVEVENVVNGVVHVTEAGTGIECEAIDESDSHKMILLVIAIALMIIVIACVVFI